MKKIVGFLFVLINLTLVGQVERNTNNVPATKNEVLDSMITAPSIYQSKESEQKTKKVSTKFVERIPVQLEGKNLEQANSFISVKNIVSHQSNRRTPTNEQQVEMDKVVDYLEKNSPNSFEFHFYKYVAGNYNVKLVSHLYEASKISPRNVDLQTQFATYYYITNNKVNLHNILSILKENGKIESDMIRFAKHLLSSVGQHETLLLHGFDDMLAVLYAQVNDEYRTDVEVISLDFLQSEHYRTSLSKKGFQVPNKSVVDVDFVKDFYKSNESKKINLSLTIPKAYVETAINDFEIIGLVFAYKNKQGNAFQENVKLLDEFKKLGSIDHYQAEKVKNISSNYLPMLLTLRNQYEAFGNTEKVKELDELIDRVGAQCKKNKLIKSYK